MTNSKEYSPEGYPIGQKNLAIEAKKRLDAQEKSAQRGEEKLNRIERLLEMLFLPKGKRI
jgi:hypothetical protein